MKALLVLSSVALALVGCGGEESDDPTPQPRFAACAYGPEGPSTHNKVKVAGGASCAEAKRFFRPHSQGVSAADAFREWDCARESRGKGGPTAFSCTDGAKRVRFLVF